MSVESTNFYFLSGGGEMGELIRTKNWSKTPIGSPHTWPQSLRTTIGIILGSKFPMFLWWGQELTCFYNDAYRPSLGQNGKHPAILGMTAQEAWPEIWDIIAPLINKVLLAGEATWSENQLIPIFRNGKMEDVYWTYSYSPVRDETDHVAGVLVTCKETTEQVITLTKLEESNLRYYNNIMQAPVAMCILRGPDYRVEIANDHMLEIWGKNADDVLNKPIFEGLPEARNQGLEYLLEHVFTTGEKYVANERAVEMPRNGRIQDIYVNFVYEAVKEPDGIISGVVATAIDVTPQVMARIKIEEADKLFRNTVRQAPVGMAILRGKDYVVEMANVAYLQLVGRQELDLIDKPLFEAIPEIRETVENLLNNVWSSGMPFHGNEVPIPVNRFGQQAIYYFDLLYYPLKDESDKITGIIVTVTDVSEKIEARKKKDQNEERLNIVLEASGLGTWELNMKTREPQYSQRYLEILGGYKEYRKLTHQELIAHLHPDDMPVRAKAFEEAKVTGQLHYEARVIWSDQSIHWMEGKGKVFYDADQQPDKLIGTVRDITAQKNHQQKLEESELRFRDLVMKSPVPKAILSGRDHVIEMANAAILNNIWKKKETDVQGKPIFDIFPELKDQKYAELLDRVYETGKTHTESEAFIYFNVNGLKNKFYVDFEYAPMMESDNSIYGIKITMIDVTEQVEARKKIEESEKRFRSLTESIPQLIWETDAAGNPLFASCKWKEYTGVSPDGENAWRQIIHPDDFDENARIWAHSLQTGEVYKCDVRLKGKDGLYRWYTVIGEPVYDKAQIIIKWVGAFTDIQTEKAFTHELERQVYERTKELEQKNVDLEKMNNELQSFAYISSHDLQEPLRKIQTFSSQIIEKELDNLSDYGKEKFQRMQTSAKRMQTLINDLLSYSRTNTIERKYEKTDLKTLIEEVKEELKEELEQRNATLELINICDVYIIPFQFTQLLYNLLSNSLKFALADKAPHIKIECEIDYCHKFNIEKLKPGQKYCRISVSDNGIGFESEYSDKIFEVFQRLHSKEKYVGTGIGLAIVKKIVENHNGLIVAKSEINNGATFDIYIPAEIMS